MLSLTADVLIMNPDISTLWNIRRETLLKMKQYVIKFPKTHFREYFFNLCISRMIEDNTSVTEAELKLTEAGLRINPKSYCAWHHRCWVLDNYASKPNWERELQLCTKYLELDERNCKFYSAEEISRHVSWKELTERLFQFIVGIIDDMWWTITVRS